MTGLIQTLIDLPFAISVILKITIVLSVGWIMHLSLVGRNPRWRVLLWRVTIVGILLVPALVPLKSLQIRVAPVPESPATSSTYSASESDVTSQSVASPVETAFVSGPMENGNSYQPRTSFSLSAWLKTYMPWILLAVWGIVATILSSRLLVQFIQIKKKINNSLPGPKHLQRMLDQVVGDLDCRRKIILRHSPELFTPFLAGFRRPVIIFPERLMSDKCNAENPAIFAHEVAHLCSGDLFWMFAVRLIEILLWFHPLVWKLRDVHNCACEEVCDAVAADYLGNTELYSSTLASVALDIMGNVLSVGGIPMVRSSDILARLRLLKRNIYSGPLARRWIAASVLIGMTIIGFLGSIKLTYTAEKRDGEISDKLLLKLIDSDGLPVGGALVATEARTRDRVVLNSNLSLSLFRHEHNISNEWGEIKLSRERGKFFSFGAEGKVPLYILHEERKIGAVCDISKDDDRSTIELTLVPVCHVHGKLKSEGLTKAGRPLTRTRVYMRWDRDNVVVLSHSSEEQRFEFFVPPGNYELKAYGSDSDGSDPPGISARTKHKILSVEIKKGQQELNLGTIDLLPTKIATLTGKPAIEIGPIKAWKNGSPVKLSELIGKVVILYFQGNAPATSRYLPKLVELYKHFHDKGLVIIALFNCESMEQLEKNWAKVFERFGGEPEVPFLIAIDGGKSSFYEGTDKIRLGATYAVYDITKTPTTVLIDTKGNVVGELNLNYAKETIQKMLGVTTVPELVTWRRKCNEVYFLEEGQVLKRIAPPFIPEREEYYRNEYSIRDIEEPPDSFTFQWDGELKNWGYVFGTKKPLEYVLEHNLSLNRNSFEGPEELLKIDLPGDWIVRKDATEEQKLKALEVILAKEINRKIRFEKRTVERQAIVAIGNFQYRRLPEANDYRRIYMFSGDFDDYGSGDRGTADSVHEFLEVIGDHSGMPVIDQTESSAEVRIPYRNYYSSAPRWIKDSAVKAEKIRQLLDNISLQTNLLFEVETRPIEKWFVVEEDQK